jgi:pimeloyl-ACP methyl ester carboxylesterase
MVSGLVTEIASIDTDGTAVGSVFRRQTVAAAGFDVTYYEAGAGDPVLYLPGAGGPHMRIALDLLARDYRVIVLELPGWGAQPNDVADFDGLAEQVALIATAIGLDTFHLMGTSLGGACALHLATLYPERVVSLVLEAPAKFREASVNPAELAPDAFVRAFRTHPERIPHMEPLDPEFLARVWPTVERLAGDGAVDERFVARLAASPTRTLVLFGRDDGVINPINGRTYRRLMKNSTLQYVYSAAHDIQGDRPEAFAETVGDFLRRGMNFMIDERDGLLNP